MTAPPQMNNAAAFRMLNRFTDCPTGPDDSSKFIPDLCNRRHGKKMRQIEGQMSLPKRARDAALGEWAFQVRGLQYLPIAV
jgi:hypothetical protein